MESGTIALVPAEDAVMDLMQTISNCRLTGVATSPFSDMADKDEGQATPPRGTDWEVVSLTASAYAAAPTGDLTEVKLGENGDVADKDQVETSNNLFMSGHFVLPPNHHENPPPDPENTEIRGELVQKDDGSESVKDSKFDANEEENWNISQLTESDGFHGIPFSNEKSNLLAFSDSDIMKMEP